MNLLGTDTIIHSGTNLNHTQMPVKHTLANEIG